MSSYLFAVYLLHHVFFLMQRGYYTIQNILPLKWFKSGKPLRIVVFPVDTYSSKEDLHSQLSTEVSNKTYISISVGYKHMNVTKLDQIQ